MRFRLLLATLPALLFALPLFAADPPKDDTARGDKMRDAYFRHEVKRIADASLADVKTKADWEKKRPELRRQFLDMLGLWPLPPRTDLKATITGKLETENFTVEKLHFQSIPGLYVTGNLYLPKNAQAAGPGDPLRLRPRQHGRSTRSPTAARCTYQHHPAWFAGTRLRLPDPRYAATRRDSRASITARITRHVVVADARLHAGRHRVLERHAALDYLETRKEVDPKRLGVTGRSGGGATSWWVGAADERAAVHHPCRRHRRSAGPCRRRASRRAFRDGVISGHCDCMYFVNTYRWDFDTVMALCAPRPLLLGNSDADDIFPVAGLPPPGRQGASASTTCTAPDDKFALLETKGPHKDTPELRRGAFRWMNRWLKNDNGEVTEREVAAV